MSAKKRVRKVRVFPPSLTAYFPEDPEYVERVHRDAERLKVSVSFIVKCVVLGGYEETLKTLERVVSAPAK